MCSSDLNTEKDFPTDSISSLNFDDKAEINNPLIGKKFYYLYKGEDDGELFLAVDDDMPTIVFINDMLIDNWNTMEGNKWTIEKIEEKDTLLTYFVKLEDGDSSIDSLPARARRPRGWKWCSACGSTKRASASGIWCRGWWCSSSR